MKSINTDDRGIVILDPDDPNATVCGACGAAWDDSVSTGWTPTPAGRCPWEDEHPTLPEPVRLSTEVTFTPVEDGWIEMTGSVTGSIEVYRTTLGKVTLVAEIDTTFIDPDDGLPKGVVIEITAADLDQGLTELFARIAEQTAADQIMFRW